MKRSKTPRRAPAVNTPGDRRVSVAGAAKDANPPRGLDGASVMYDNETSDVSEAIATILVNILVDIVSPRALIDSGSWPRQPNERNPDRQERASRGRAMTTRIHSRTSRTEAGDSIRADPCYGSLEGFASARRPTQISPRVSPSPVPQSAALESLPVREVPAADPLAARDSIYGGKKPASLRTGCQQGAPSVPAGGASSPLFPLLPPLF